MSQADAFAESTDINVWYFAHCHDCPTCHRDLTQANPAENIWPHWVGECKKMELKLKTAEEVNAILAAHSAQDERNVRRVMGEQRARRLPLVKREDWKALLFIGGALLALTLLTLWIVLSWWV